MKGIIAGYSCRVLSGIDACVVRQFCNLVRDEGEEGGRKWVPMTGFSRQCFCTALTPPRKYAAKTAQP